MKVEPDYEHFIEEYGLLKMPSMQALIAVIYYAFTTLSTVGLGDFHPKNDFERVLCSIIMLVGVTCTSVLLQFFERTLKEFQSYITKFNQIEELGIFFSTMRKFNQGAPLSEDFVKQFENYFHYRWDRDKLVAVSTFEDL